ncbi:PPOX class F420-dependent oxidoreductase [Candidatus Oscillochloris fontis]|uniref:PPOX class F420-dependent oxidoreductase n=1 Tax=Candidatus Oscillochloris fontis TaxID=2496868 RepID=UPI00101C96AC|nr:PPOX class F420-dependent oxidoreductase [Candidatus Oscillochloris fontis]
MSQVPQPDTFTALNKHQYANLFTYRKNGEAIKTPIWFALKNGKFYVVTTKNSGKVKRIRNNGRVMIGPSDARGNPRGETIEARARVLGPDEVEIAKIALDEKYGLMKAVFEFFITMRGVERDWVEIAPA